MLARIYKPARTAMQSGEAKTKRWVLEFAPEVAREIEPLMGWTSSSDMNSQVRMFFETKERAVAFATKHKIAHEVEEAAAEGPREGKSYTDNFRFNRVEPWTH
jgi:hypothetical protein